MRLTPRLSLPLALALAGCARPSPLEDQVALRQGLQGDERVVLALRQVDDLALRGDPAGAASALVTRARPASSQSVQQAQALQVRSPWGAPHLQSLRCLVEDRAASLDRYEAALRGEQIERVVEALEEQKSLDRRGAALADALARPPEP